MSTSASADVIAIDGPSASGKGTVAQTVAQSLGYHYLDSGAIYRAAAHAAGVAGIDLDNAAAHEARIAAVAGAMDLRFSGAQILLANRDVGAILRSEACGREASKIAALPAVRAALMQRQRDFRRAPGLVADGRDMGSVVFPQAVLKVYLTAGVEERARRRTAQLRAAQAPANPAKGLIENEKGGNIDALSKTGAQADVRLGADPLFETVLADLRARDERDSKRAVAPLAQQDDARHLDTSGLTIAQAVQQVLAWYAALRMRQGRQQQSSQ